MVPLARLVPPKPLACFFLSSLKTTGAMLFAMFYTTSLSFGTMISFGLFVHAFWQWHKVKLSQVKISVAVRMYSLETTFHVMV